MGIGGSLLIAAYHIFLFVGEQGTTSAAAAIVVSLSPILTTGFARAFLPDERLTTLGIVGLLSGSSVSAFSQPRPGDLLNPRTVSLFLASSRPRRSPSGACYPSVRRRPRDRDGGSVVDAARCVLSTASSASPSRSPTFSGLRGRAALLYLVVVGQRARLPHLLRPARAARSHRNQPRLVRRPRLRRRSPAAFLSEAPTVHGGGFTCILVGFGLLKRDALRNEVARFSGTPNRGE